MNKRELKIKLISIEFAKWRVRIEQLSSLNLYDANLFSEDSICEILNSIFDYKLTNVNSIISNHPAIDLADKYNRIAVQVTSTKSSRKIQSTLDKYFENNLDSEYDELFIIILGKKQLKYSTIKVKTNYNFDVNKHIVDFEGLLSFIRFLPTSRIERIANLLENEHIPSKELRTKLNAKRVRRNLSLRNRLKKDLLIDIDRDNWEIAACEPSFKFKYRNAIIRSVDDTKWPDPDLSEGISSWFKGEFWDFYENGVELIDSGGKAIFDKDGNWDVLDYKGDSRSNNKHYQVVNFQYFLRIPYDYIVTCDMEPDNYYGIPTLHVEYAKNGMPYEEIILGIAGKYDKENRINSRLTNYFDSDKRKKLAQ